MGNLDIVYVTYNSQKYIKKCFASVLNSEFDIDKLFIYVVDNGSVDDTLRLLRESKAQFEARGGHFKIIKSKKNLGFGMANNLGFKKGNSENVCFFNIDTEVFPDTLRIIEDEIANADKTFAMWELRQFPYEHPKIYNAVTMEETWASGAAFVIRREVFKKLKGFDPHIFMYAEDVDLSWKLRSQGYKIKYIPKASIIHYSYEKAGEIKPGMYTNSLMNNLLLRYRYGSIGHILYGERSFIRLFLLPEAYPGSKKDLLRTYLKHFTKIGFFINRNGVGKSTDFRPQFYGFDYETIRDGAFYQNTELTEFPLVSVIVRTCGRPSVLRETMLSLRNQTYPNMEVVVVEDGPAVSQKMLEEEFGDLNILYYASGEKVGRSKNGNTGCRLAHGQLLNFLDDDDLFYADHVETLVREKLKSGAAVEYSFAFETPITVLSKEPYRYKIWNYYGTHKQYFNRAELCYHNYLPIQAVMFDKNLFEQYGGFDETLDALEDWDMWLRYATHVDFHCTGKTTSIYRTPHEKEHNSARQAELDAALLKVRKKHKSYPLFFSAYDCAVLYESCNKDQIQSTMVQQAKRLILQKCIYCYRKFRKNE